MGIASIFGLGRRKAPESSFLRETRAQREERLRAAVSRLVEGRADWQVGQVSSRHEELHEEETLAERNDVKRFRARKAVEARWTAEIEARLAREEAIDGIERGIASGALEAARLHCHNELCEIAVRADGKRLTPDEARGFPYCLGCNCEIIPAARK